MVKIKPKQQKNKGNPPPTVFIEIIPPPKAPQSGAVPQQKTHKGAISVKEEKKKVDEDCKEWYGGIGVYINEASTITDIMPGYPAQEAGLIAGDTIEAIGGIEIKGVPETKVVLQVTRLGMIYFMTIERNKICTAEKKEKP